jgi:hypothetical protein
LPSVANYVIGWIRYKGDVKITIAQHSSMSVILTDADKAFFPNSEGDFIFVILFGNLNFLLVKSKTR